MQQLDTVRELIAKGWTPPEEAIEPYRHILLAYYKGRGWETLAKGRLDHDDVRTIVSLLGVFDHFGIPIPEPVEEPHREAA